MLAASSLLMGAILIVARVRRVALPTAAAGLIATGLLGLALAAGDLHRQATTTPDIAVMIDLSGSTRGAAYHDETWRRQRLEQLLGDSPRREIPFSGNTRDTAFTPAPADAILLFSDARIALPASAPPTFVIVDPQLESPPDAAVISLELRNDTAVATVRNTGDPRELTWTMADQSHTVVIAPGERTITHEIAPSIDTVTARFAAGDIWPENDALSIRRPPPLHAQRWWIGDEPPDGGWLHLHPSQLTQDSLQYLGAATIVLDNVPADALSPVQQQRLGQYVTDLGGTLMLLGGDQAFAAGHYPGTNLESLSPLSSTPPEPETHWIILIDRSGSMASPLAGRSRWSIAVDSVRSAIRSLPENDLLSLYSFARDLRASGSTAAVGEMRDVPLFQNVTPQGPTNLAPALLQIASLQRDGPPVHLLLLTDGQSPLDDAPAIGASLRDRGIHLHLLAIGEIEIDHPLRRIVESTQGGFVRQSDPHQWADAARDLLRSAQPDHLITQPTEVFFERVLRPLPPRTINRHNATWLKREADLLARTDATPLAAHWRVGAGQVVAFSFRPIAREIEALDRSFAASPRDPRFRVTMTAGPEPRIRIHAGETGNQGYLNQLPLTLELRALRDGALERFPIPQTAPGEYALAFPPPQTPSIAAVKLHGRTLDRIAIPARYDPEFNTIGNHHDAMRDFASRTGGGVIEPADTARIQAHAPMRRRSLSSSLAISGALLVTIGLVYWRLK